MASILKVNTLTGVTAAGTIAVTAEGGTVTTNLQQGLAKSWASLDGTGTAALRDSFNTTSITDNGTGDYTFTFNNDFSNRNRAVSMTNNAGENGTLGYQVSEIQTPTTGLTRVGGAQADNNAGDQETVYVIAHGDLA